MMNVAFMRTQEAVNGAGQLAEAGQWVASRRRA